MAASEVKDFAGKVDGGGYKASMDDPKKVPMWLIPGALLRGVAGVLQYGAKKYAANNWRRGMAWSEVVSAMQRHSAALNDGEWLDPETGKPHIHHIGCCVAFLSEYAENPIYAKFNDLYARPEAP